MLRSRLLYICRHWVCDTVDDPKGKRNSDCLYIVIVNKNRSILEAFPKLVWIIINDFHDFQFSVAWITLSTYLAACHLWVIGGLSEIATGIRFDTGCCPHCWISWRTCCHWEVIALAERQFENQRHCWEKNKPTNKGIQSKKILPLLAISRIDD